MSRAEPFPASVSRPLPQWRQSRRGFLRRAAAATTFGSSACAWLPALAAQLAGHPDRRRQCLLLWMAGGPSQLDTFDLKPGQETGGEFHEIATTEPSIRISEHLPRLAQLARHLAIVRSLSTKEGDHARGAYLVRTGQRPGSPLRYPCLGSALSKELSSAASELPQYVSIGSPDFLNPAAFSPGFLGPEFAAATVGVLPDAPAPDGAPPGFPRLGLDYLRPSDGSRLAWREQFWDGRQRQFLGSRSADNAVTQDTVYRRALRLMQSPAAQAFDLSREPDTVRERYGRSVFGQGCLLARRLLEHGVPFVEVTLGGTDAGGLGWDTHLNNFATVRQLSAQLDAGWASLLSDLEDRGQLATTTILWIGEFGRTPVINANAGRDHYPNAWSCVFAGGGIQGGQVYGRTSEDGQEIVDQPVAIADVLATLCTALGVDPARENMTDIGRPIKISEGTAIRDLLA